MTRLGFRRRERDSLRLRLVMITATAVTVIVAVGWLLIIAVVRDEVLDTADWLARARAEEIAESAATGELPAVLPDVDEGETAVQVVREGRVVSATPTLAQTGALPLPRLQPGDRRMVEVGRIQRLGSGPFHVAAVGVVTPEGPSTVYAAVSTEDVEELVGTSLSTGTFGLALLLPALIVVLWMAIGRTLGPVEQIRRRADAITVADLSERVPVPAREDEIGRLARTINSMLSRLELSVSEQRRFVADAAHELRSPVASLRTQLETALQGEADGGRREELAGLLTDTLRMQALVDQLLLLARSDAHALDHVRIVVDLDDVVDTVLTSRQLEGQEGDVTVDASEVTAVRVVGDPVLLEQVVRNLFDNALRHASGEVRVALRRTDAVAVLTVDDDGPGIPKGMREDVFHRFTRLDDSRDRDHGGAGLGLAITADVVRTHRGSVEILDSPTGGARLRVTLPTGEVTASAPRSGT